MSLLDDITRAYTVRQVSDVNLVAAAVSPIGTEVMIINEITCRSVISHIVFFFSCFCFVLS